MSERISNHQAPDRMEVDLHTLQEAPSREASGAGTPDASAHHQDSSERQAGMSVYAAVDIEPDNLKNYALDILEEVHRRQEHLRFHRLHYMHLARQYGATFREIGDCLCITPQAVMYALKNSSEVAP